jgi:hypothetical protein
VAALTADSTLQDLAQTEAMRLASIGFLDTTNPVLKRYGVNFGTAVYSPNQEYTGELNKNLLSISNKIC